MAFETPKSWVEVSTIIQAIAIASGVFFTVYQLFIAGESARQERNKYTFSLIQQINQPPITTALEELGNALDQQNKSRKQNLSTPQDFVEFVTSDREVEHNVMQIAAYYEMFAACLNSGFCEPAIARRIMEPNMEYFFAYYGDYLLNNWGFQAFDDYTCLLIEWNAQHAIVKAKLKYGDIDPTCELVKDQNYDYSLYQSSELTASQPRP